MRARDRMKHVVVAVSVAAGAASLVGIPGPAQASSWPGCKTFSNQPAAQRAWEKAGRPAIADGDGDGKVCESLPASGGDGKQAPGCKKSRSVLKIREKASQFPHHALLLKKAWSVGQPRVLHYDPGNNKRDTNLAGIPTKAGFDRDEYPYNASREASPHSTIAYVASAENQAEGRFFGARIRGFCAGQAFRIVLIGRVPAAMRIELARVGTSGE
mgnify:CR=1 FL=1